MTSAIVYATSAVYALVALVAFVRWRAERSDGARWAALALTCLATGILISTLAPAAEETPAWVSDLTLALIALFPYYLYRFAATFSRRRRGLDLVAASLTVAVIAGAVVLPAMPVGDGPRPAALWLYLILFLIQWTVLSSFAVLRLWRSGRGQSTLARHRMRMLSLASMGLNLAIAAAVVSPAAENSIGNLIVQLLGLGSGIAFYLGFTPPLFIREIWRRPEQEKLGRAIEGLMAAASVDEVVESLLPQVAAIVAAKGAALTDAEGTVLGAHGVSCEEAAAFAENEASGVGQNGLVRHVVPLGEHAGHLIVWTNQYTPYFGRDELSLLRTMGSMTRVSLERALLIERDRTARAALEQANSGLVATNEALEEEIVERKRAEDEARRSQSFLDSIVDNIPHTVFVKKTEDLRFVSLNKAGEELLGFPREEFIGKNVHDLFPREQADAFLEQDRDVLREGRLVDIPVECVETRDHGPRLLRTKKIPIHDESGEVEYMMGISEDITERRRYEQEAQEARESAERANRAKSDFLSRMSHELRTPLNGILGFTQLLQMDDLQEDQRESLGQIVKAGRHLLELINEVLDISRIEAGRLSLSVEPVLVAAVVAESVDLIKPLAVQEGITLEADIPPSLTDTHVKADHQRLKQVVLNLLSNSVKYNSKGGTVTISFSRAGSDRVCLTVTDTGSGMSSRSLERLFIPFDRLGAEQGNIEGTGLGLVLSKRLVEAMEGDLTVTSKLGQGSTFTVDLPYAEFSVEKAVSPPVAAPTGGYERSEPEVRPELHSGTLLYIEDNLSNLKLVERILKHRPGVTLLPAMQGGLGIDLAIEHGPRVILLDLNLPDMDGHRVLHKLQADEDTRSIPVVILSADATKSQIERLINAGAAGYVTKPFDVGEFLALVDSYFQVTPSLQEVE